MIQIVMHSIHYDITAHVCTCTYAYVHLGMIEQRASLISSDVGHAKASVERRARADSRAQHPGVSCVCCELWAYVAYSVCALCYCYADTRARQSVSSQQRMARTRTSHRIARATRAHITAECVEIRISYARDLRPNKHAAAGGAAATSAPLRLLVVLVVLVVLRSCRRSGSLVVVTRVAIRTASSRACKPSTTSTTV